MFLHFSHVLDIRVIHMRTYNISYSESSSIPTKAELLTLDVPNFLIFEIWDYVMEYAAPIQPVSMQTFLLL